jgi:hypothetical protein
MELHAQVYLDGLDPASHQGVILVWLTAPALVMAWVQIALSGLCAMTLLFVWALAALKFLAVIAKATLV